MGTKRLTKLDRMTPEQKAMESTRFWEAERDASFPPETIAIILGKSLSWLQSKRCSGNGIPFNKPDGKKIIFYQKSDVLYYLNKTRYAHTR